MSGWTGEWTRRATLFDRPSRAQHARLWLRRDRIKPWACSPRASAAAVDHAAGRRDRAAQVSLRRTTRSGRTGCAASSAALRPLPLRCHQPEHAQELRRCPAGIWSQDVVGVRTLRRPRYFINAGYGFNNDARGVTIRVDPATGDPADPATPLVRSRAPNSGCAPRSSRTMQSSLSLWYLSLDSELVFVGDAGSTEAGRPSRRYGTEWSTRWTPMPWMLVDLDLSWNHARFTEDAPEGDFVPGAPTGSWQPVYRCRVTGRGRARCSCATSALTADRGQQCARIHRR